MAIEISDSWTPGPRHVSLGSREVHVWRAPLDMATEARARMSLTLSPDEQARAARFATDKLRHRWVAGRGILRTLLASYLGQPATEIRFRYGEHEKPYLAGATLEDTLHFNVSHSHDLALFAFSRDQEIGVDLEWVRSDLEQTAIATRFFSNRESETLENLPADEQIEYFFALWTCKESFVKAKGGGITFGLDRFDVQLEPGGDSAPIVSNEPRERFAPWFAYRLDPGSGFAGALAIEDPDPQVSLWNWSTAL